MKYVSGHVRRENLPANTKTCRVFFRWESYLTKNRIDNAVFREVCSKYRTWDERFSFAKGKATAVYQHLTTAIISSAIYGASEENAAKVECNNSERDAIVALRNLVAMLGTKIDRAGKTRKNMFVIDATSIKCIYVLCAGRKPMELCAPEVFNKKIVPFLLFCAAGEELSAAANMTAGEVKRQQERREESRKKVAPELLEEAQEANKKLSVEKETVMTDNCLLKEKLDKVRKYVEENEILSRELLLEMLKD